MVHCNNSAIKPRCQHTVRFFGRANTGAHPCQARGRGWAHPAAPVPGHARGQTLVLVGTGRARQGLPPPPLAQKKRSAHIEYSRHSFSLVPNLSKYLCQGGIFGTTGCAKIPRIPDFPLLFYARVHRNYTGTRSDEIVGGPREELRSFSRKKGVSMNTRLRLIYV